MAPAAGLESLSGTLRALEETCKVFAQGKHQVAPRRDREAEPHVISCQLRGKRPPVIAPCP